VLIFAGVQVPVMPFVEVPESAGAEDPWQSGPIPANEGVNKGFTVTDSEPVFEHCPDDGVKV